MCWVMSLVCPSIASGRSCQFWACSEHVSMPRTIQSPAKCEVHAVIRFLHAEGCNAAEIHRRMTVKLPWVTASSDFHLFAHMKRWLGGQKSVARCLRQTSDLLAIVSCEQRDENQRELSVMKVWPYTLLIRRWILAALLYPSACRNRMTTPTSHLAGDCIVPGMFTCSLRVQNWQLPSDAIEGHTRDIAQHICTDGIFTLVFIWRPIGSCK